MRPQPWFEKAIKALDSNLELVPKHEEGCFYLVRRTRKGNVKWTNVTVPWNRQDETMLTFIRRCDSWNERQHTQFKAEQAWLDTEGTRDGWRKIEDRTYQHYLDAGRSASLSPIYQSAPVVGDTFAKGQIDSLTKEASAQSDTSGSS